MILQSLQHHRNITIVVILASEYENILAQNTNRLKQKSVSLYETRSVQFFIGILLLPKNYFIFRVEKIILLVFC